MPILKTQEDKYGHTWAYDADEGWKPIDREALEGSFMGNVMRSAGREMQTIGVGTDQAIQQFTRGQVPPAVDARAQQLAGEQQRAGNAAPWATGVGQVLPDVGAGVLGAVAAPEAAVPAMLMREALLGAATGAARPGSIEERLQRAVTGAGLGVAGGALGEVASAGISRGLAVGQGIANRMTGRVAEAVDAGAARVRGSAARTMDEMVPGGQPEAQAAEGIQPGGSTAGAQRTPQGLQGDEHMMEEQALSQTEAAGANIDTAGERAIRARVEDMGYRSPLGAGTRSGSAARWLAGRKEITPWTDPFSQQMKADNQKLMAKTVGEAMGMKDWETITPTEMSFAEATIGDRFNKLGKQIPKIDANDLADAIEGISQTKGVFGNTQAEKMIGNAVENARGHGGELSGAEIMKDRQFLQGEMAQFYKNGQTSQGEALAEAIDRLDTLIQRNAKRLGDADIGDRWTQARKQWQVYEMAKRAGSTNAQGDVNPVSFFNAMKKDRASGGFGQQGPEHGTPQRKAFDLARIMAADQSGIPMTGARLGPLLDVSGRAAGALGLTAVGSSLFNGLTGR